MRSKIALLVVAVIAAAFLASTAVDAQSEDTTTLTYEGYDRGRARGYDRDTQGPTITLTVPNSAFPVTVDLDPDKSVGGDLITFVVKDDGPPPSTTTTTSTIPPSGDTYCDEDRTLVIGHSNSKRWGGEMHDRYGWISGGIGGQDISDWIDNWDYNYENRLDRYERRKGNREPVQIATVLTERIGTPPDPQVLSDFEDVYLPQLIVNIRASTPSVETIILRSRMYGGWSNVVRNGSNGEPGTQLHNEAMERFAAANDGVEYVDVWEFENPPLDHFEKDGTHPNEHGGRWVADKFVEEAC